MTHYFYAVSRDAQSAKPISSSSLVTPSLDPAPRHLVPNEG
jgi:hypothetical protein